MVFVRKGIALKELSEMQHMLRGTHFHPITKGRNKKQKEVSDIG